MAFSVGSINNPLLIMHIIELALCAALVVLLSGDVFQAREKTAYREIVHATVYGFMCVSLIVIISYCAGSPIDRWTMVLLAPVASVMFVVSAVLLGLPRKVPLRNGEVSGCIVCVLLAVTFFIDFILHVLQLQKELKVPLPNTPAGPQPMVQTFPQALGLKRPEQHYYRDPVYISDSLSTSSSISLKSAQKTPSKQSIASIRSGSKVLEPKRSSTTSQQRSSTSQPTKLPSTASVGGRRSDSPSVRSAKPSTTPSQLYDMQSDTWDRIIGSVRSSQSIGQPNSKDRDEEHDEGSDKDKQKETPRSSLADDDSYSSEGRKSRRSSSKHKLKERRKSSNLGDDSEKEEKTSRSHSRNSHSKHETENDDVQSKSSITTEERSIPKDSTDGDNIFLADMINSSTSSVSKKSLKGPKKSLGSSSIDTKPSNTTDTQKSTTSVLKSSMSSKTTTSGKTKVPTAKRYKGKRSVSFSKETISDVKSSRHSTLPSSPPPKRPSTPLRVAPPPRSAQKERNTSIDPSPLPTAPPRQVKVVKGPDKPPMDDPAPPGGKEGRPVSSVGGSRIPPARGGRNAGGVKRGAP